MSEFTDDFLLFELSFVDPLQVKKVKSQKSKAKDQLLEISPLAWFFFFYERASYSIASSGLDQHTVIMIVNASRRRR